MDKIKEFFTMFIEILKGLNTPFNLLLLIVFIGAICGVFFLRKGEKKKKKVEEYKYEDEEE